MLQKAMQSIIESNQRTDDPPGSDGAPLLATGPVVKEVSRRVFLGHGRASLWRELALFLQDRLKLPYEEFNRESPAGKSHKEHLLKMLSQARFAFLIMTGEDEGADGSLHARENVIHEAGLFQGRLGFEKAIILLEEGCREFSNTKAFRRRLGSGAK